MFFFLFLGRELSLNESDDDSLTRCWQKTLLTCWTQRLLKVLFYLLVSLLVSLILPARDVTSYRTAIKAATLIELCIAAGGGVEEGACEKGGNMSINIGHPVEGTLLRAPWQDALGSLRRIDTTKRPLSASDSKVRKRGVEGTPSWKSFITPLKRPRLRVSEFINLRCSLRTLWVSLNAIVLIRNTSYLSLFFPQHLVFQVHFWD